jgi:hypothetical protein
MAVAVRWNVPLRTGRTWLWNRDNGCWLLILLIFLPFGAEARNVAFRHYRTSVTPEAGETLQDRCFYQLLLPVADHPVRSIFVIFERGWQVGNLYYDSANGEFCSRA